jgi:hypothetical protein
MVKSAINTDTNIDPHILPSLLGTVTQVNGMRPIKKNGAKNDAPHPNIIVFMVMPPFLKFVLSVYRA